MLIGSFSSACSSTIPKLPLIVYFIFAWSALFLFFPTVLETPPTHAVEDDNLGPREYILQVPLEVKLQIAMAYTSSPFEHAPKRILRQSELSESTQMGERPDGTGGESLSKDVRGFIASTPPKTDMQKAECAESSKEYKIHLISKPSKSRNYVELNEERRFEDESKLEPVDKVEGCAPSVTVKETRSGLRKYSMGKEPVIEKEEPSFENVSSKKRRLVGEDMRSSIKPEREQGSVINKQRNLKSSSKLEPVLNVELCEAVSTETNRLGKTSGNLVLSSAGSDLRLNHEDQREHKTRLESYVEVEIGTVMMGHFGRLVHVKPAVKSIGIRGTSSFRQELHCQPCGKRFSGISPYRQHIESRKHATALRQFSLSEVNEEIRTHSVGHAKVPRLN